jgi:putative endopeptidase
VPGSRAAGTNKGTFMIRTVLTLTASVAALALAMPAAAQEERTPTPTMEFGTWGFDPALLDQAVHPGDDFFAYANGKWVRENPIPPEFTRFGAFNILREKSTADVEALVADLVQSDPAAGTPGRRIVDAYQSYLDTAAIDAAGLAPAQPYLQQIFAAPDLAALAALFAEPGMPRIISAGVTVDSKDPNSYIASIGFDGMGLPDRDYYLVDNERNLEIRERYKDYLAFLLGKAGYADPRAAAEAVYSFELAVAVLEWDRTALRNRDITYNKLTRDEVLALAPRFPAARLLEANELGSATEFLLAQIPPTPEEVSEYGLTAKDLAGIGGGTPAMMRLLSEAPLATIKAYLAARFLSDHASVLPGEFDEANFAFFGKFLQGQEEQRPRWKRAIAEAEGQLGEQLGKRSMSSATSRPRTRRRWTSSSPTCARRWPKSQPRTTG